MAGRVRAGCRAAGRALWLGLIAYGRATALCGLPPDDDRAAAGAARWVAGPAPGQATAFAAYSPQEQALFRQLDDIRPQRYAGRPLDD
ncbi:hypothetical protein AB0C29_27175 [Actinoplanes sp. NPDC048791]|jgi:hypothetical protein|uniref:hypothetical protein n=1 Tax=unclassified Actinoplanes TaxID=2626549 RepID=UPI0033C8DECA